MVTVKVGFNKVLGISFIGLAGLQLFTYSMSQRQMYLVLAALWVLLGVLYVAGTCFIVEIGADGSGEVLLKNPFGMTLKRHEFAGLDDLSVRGNKLFVRRTDGVEKSVGGFGADGLHVKKLGELLDKRRADRG